MAVDYFKFQKQVEMMRIHEGEIGLARVAGVKMPQAPEQEFFIVFHDSGDVLYDGRNATVARLVASCFKVPVY